MENHQDGQVLEYLLCEEGLRELDLVILKKMILWETPDSSLAGHMRESGSSVVHGGRTRHNRRELNQERFRLIY